MKTTLPGSAEVERWFSRSTIRFVAPVLAALTVMLCAAVVSLEVLSTIRAYVGGEGLFSKGQKNATYYLAQYSVSHSDEDYQLYRTAIAFPLGDRQARLSLQQRPINLAAARAGFLAGGNDPADLDSIIWLFRLFGNVGLVREAIEIWAEGDSYTLRICALAERARQPLPPAQAAAESAAIRAELQIINRELTPLAARFSSKLGEAARLTRTVLVLALTLSSILTGLLCIQVTRARVRERDAKERGLTRMTELYAALSRTSQLISRVDNHEDLFEELCRICVGTSGLKLAIVGLTEPGTTTVRIVASHGADTADLAGNLQLMPVAPSDGLPVVRNRILVASGSPFHSTASFPLRRNDELVGVLSVYSEENDFFQRDIVDLVVQLAMEASFALVSLQREKDRRYQAAILADQNRILSLVASGATLREIFTTMVQFVESQCRDARCMLLELDQGGSQYALVAAPTMRAGFEQDVLDASFRGDTNAWDRAIHTRSAILSPVQEPLSATGLDTVSAWPILGPRGQILGAIALFGTRGSSAHLLSPHLLRISTDLAGIAIESRRAADRIQHLAHHDDLTGLPNRLLFNHHLPRALMRAQRSGRSVGVLFLDLDRFKVINDTLGHDAGDAVLCQIADHLRRGLRETDTLARVGGDEFTLIVEQFSDPQDLVLIAQKLLAAAATPLSINGHECHLSGSIGIALYPKDGMDSASLLKNADIAMYRAKAAGRNNFQFYAHEINDNSVERLSLENELRHAVERREFVVHYQPKFDIQSNSISGAEALVRWNHPTRGLLSPSVFICVAEETGIIGSIGRLVLETVCTDASRWIRNGFDPIRIAVNLSAQQFADSRLLEDLDNVLKETGCEATSLEFEITESVVMTSPDRALAMLNQIKERNITLAIDDFGTGHSSLAYLKRFPVDRVKIDRTFVRDISSSHNDLAITKAIIALGHSMGLKVVAEGVETDIQLEILRRNRCDECQGYVYGRAVPAAAFERFLTSEELSELAGQLH